MWPIRDNFRSTLGSIVQAGTLSGIRARRKRRTALMQRRMTTTGGIPFGQQTTPADAATRSGPRETTQAGSSRPQDRRARKAEKSTLLPRSGERVAFAEKNPQVFKGKKNSNQGRDRDREKGQTQQKRKERQNHNKRQ
ncbi:hypothetical protein NDU88_004319 [Pleurodeles waltl]|uniref:Uncharacterized protein n=1 Tax=Pleurodeles waltl TaxID=8319 RepID=A0AAV7MGB0_PLEWA|nr:hypothetical protein NDU88_004319 [Pleurodeles waltl]